VSETDPPRPFTVRALGEIAIRCRDLPAMERFYGGVLGLRRLAPRSGGITFYALGESWRGHTAVLALFGPDASRAGAAEGGARSTLHHVALSVDWEAQDAIVNWLGRHGLPATVERFDWIGWRGVFTRDPEGNTVELVAARPQGRIRP